MASHIVIALLFFVSFSFAQLPEKIQRYRADAKGDYAKRRQGLMDANHVRTLFSNNGEVGGYLAKPPVEWPKGSGIQFLTGYTFMVGAYVRAPGNGLGMHLIETSYYEQMPTDPATGLIWGLEPFPDI